MSSTPTTDELPEIQRSRISQKMAFPVGYELLRSHFGTADWWLDAAFYFSAHPTLFASDFAQILKTGQAYRVLRIERWSDYAPRLSKKRHRFTICPVLREFKSIAREALVTQSFPTLRDFIDGIPASFGDHRAISAIFDPSDGTCRIE